MRLSGLAPGGVCLAASIATGAGGLLHHRFTLALWKRRAFRYAMRISVALAVRFPCLAVSQHRALWSADFPRGERQSDSPRDRPADPVGVG